MRELLFRGKRVDNGEWVEGNLFVPDKEDTPTQICIGTNIVRITYDIIPETIGQYTGLKDKNGRKIFEGDVIVGTDAFDNNVKYIVDYKQTAFCASQLGVNYSTYLGNFDNGKNEIEIIGNIYDNPELLKDGE